MFPPSGKVVTTVQLLVPTSDRAIAHAVPPALHPRVYHAFPAQATSAPFPTENPDGTLLVQVDPSGEVHIFPCPAASQRSPFHSNEMTAFVTAPTFDQVTPSVDLAKFVVPFFESPAAIQ